MRRGQSCGRDELLAGRFRSAAMLVQRDSKGGPIGSCYVRRVSHRRRLGHNLFTFVEHDVELRFGVG